MDMKATRQVTNKIVSTLKIIGLTIGYMYTCLFFKKGKIDTNFVSLYE